MAEGTICEKNCYSITWFINNLSYCWQKKNEAIVSPVFSIFMPEETKWKLLLFPRGTSIEGFISLFLCRDRDCNGAESIEVEYTLEFLGADGSIVTKGELVKAFCKNNQWGFPNFRFRNLVFRSKRMKYLPQDILTVCCRMKLGRKLAEKSVENRDIFARTIINVERKSLLWTIEEFSSLRPDEKRYLVIKSASKEELIKIELLLTGGQCSEEQINLNIRCGDGHIKFFTLKTSILDSEKSIVDAGDFECMCNLAQSTKFTLKQSKSKLLRNKDLYLPCDVLTLKLEFATTTGSIFEGIEEIDFGTISHKTTNEALENWRKCNAVEKTEDSCTLINDLLSLYQEQSLCDVKLQTKTKIFPVHLSILGARSPVFKAMFASEMKEKLNGCVNAFDLDDETAHQLLEYMYTGKLKELEWQDTIKLYKAADKYTIISLKDQCSLLLKNKLDLGNACRALILSDLHQDEDFKIFTQNFILRNAKEIFQSEEWKLLVNSNSKLALETALRNWRED